MDFQTFLNLNVGGKQYRFLRKTLVSRPSLLREFAVCSHEERLTIADGYIEEDNEYFFERPAFVFDIVYSYFVTGQYDDMDLPCEQILKTELIFWKIPEILEFSVDESEKSEAPNPFQSVMLGRCRQYMWNFLEVPESSKYAQYFSFFCLSVVLFSNACLVLSSIPELQNETETGREPKRIFGIFEYLCVFWFTGEYVLKLAVASNRFRFFIHWLNLADLIVILPFYFELIIHPAGEYFRDVRSALLVARMLRLLRAIRVFKLIRYSAGLQSFALTLAASRGMLNMLMVILGTGVIFFSNLMYFVERDEPNSPISNVPAALWFCIVTMTTTGYGDTGPVTAAGQFVAVGAIVCGIIVLAMPITVVVDNFAQIHGGQEMPPDRGRTSGKSEQQVESVA